MKKHRIAIFALAVCLLLTACGAYKPAGEATGHEALDSQVLTVLQEICASDRTLAENARAAYDWVANETQYRAGTADTSGGFTEELTQELALEMITKRRGNCDGEAALMAVLLRRVGCEAVIVQGEFLRESGDWVEHAWVVAQVDGAWYHFDPLYGKFYAGDRIGEYCMADDALLLQTHRWEQSLYPACE